MGNSTKNTRNSISPKEAFSLAKTFEQASLMSLSLVTLPVLFLFLGLFIDKKLDTTPIFIIIGVVVGIGSGIYRAIRLSKNIKLESPKPKDE
jgi:F0F1-type ATP synthase assembly protein I